MKRVALSRVSPVDRVQFILEMARDKDVLHLGCVDHPFLEEKLAAGQLLHGQIGRVARSLHGVDLDADGIRRLREAGFSNLHQGDVERLDSLGFGRRFDIVIAGELVEHLANPGMFLAGVGRCLAVGGSLLVTVPSAQSIRIVANAFRLREVVHPDHNAYYSPHTLRHLLEAHGFDVHELRPYWTQARSRPVLMGLYDRFLRMSRYVSPWLGEGLVAVARLRT